ncbi:MAG: M48 family metalloprotease [Pseudoxanthomonas sp.]
MHPLEARRKLVERLEREVQEAPGRYAFKLSLLAALGYAVLVAALALTLGLLAFIVLYTLIVRPPIDPWIAIPIIVLGMTGTVVLRSVWIRFVPPEGHHLQPGEAPELRAEVERVRNAVGAGPLHGIVINAELNAAAAYVPDGLALWRQKHYLILGLPLLQALDRRELAAVIAHEFGHFHGRHERFAGWIYRLRSSWHRLMEGMAGEGIWGGQLLWLFFRWYAPYFDAYSYVLARRHEYAADAVGAQVAGAEAMASALVRMELASDWLHGEFWPQVERSARVQSYPPMEVQERLAERLQQILPEHARIPARLLGREPGLDDTHPTLEKRLAALRIDNSLPIERIATDIAQESASLLLGDRLVPLRERFSREWQAAAKPEWQALHRQSEIERNRLAELEAHPSHTPAEAVELACLSEYHRLGVDALPLYLSALERAPSDARGQYRLGALLLKREREAEGIERLQRAMELDVSLIAPVLRCLDDHARGLPVESAVIATIETLRAQYLPRMREPQTRNASVADEDLLPHALEAAQLRDLARTLRGHEKVRGAWIARKRLQGAEVMPHYLIALDWAGSVASERAALPRIAGQLALSGSCTLLTFTSEAPLARRIRQAVGEATYQRP